MGELNKKLVGKFWSGKGFNNVLICEDNKQLLHNLGAEVFVKSKKKNDNSDTEK